MSIFALRILLKINKIGIKGSIFSIGNDRRAVQRGACIDRLHVFSIDSLPGSMDINGSFVADLHFITNKRDLDIGVNLYEQTAAGKYLQLSNNIFRASYNLSGRERKLITPGEPVHMVFNNSFFTSRRLERGSRLMLGVNKNQDWEINYGTGKNTAKEHIGDAGEPLRIQWLKSSSIQVPVWRY